MAAADGYALPLTRNQACGPIEIAPLIPDCPLGLVCFTTACETHNQCYGICGVSRAKCDDEFFQSMMDICTRRFVFGDPDMLTCRSLALTYWFAVQTLGQEAFDATQRIGCASTEPNNETPGVCCTGTADCDDSGTRADCLEIDGAFFAFFTCNDFDCTPPENDDCGTASTACEPVDIFGLSGTCTGTGEPCEPESDECPDGANCLPDEYRCHFSTDNRLASTDGPGTGRACTVSSVENFQADVWYRYAAPCSGRLIVRMCDDPGYDAMLAVYGTSDPNDACTCQVEESRLLACDDDFCGGGSVSAVVLDDVVEGACFTIRVGGWSNDGSAEQAKQGLSELDVRMECARPIPP